MIYVIMTAAMINQSSWSTLLNVATRICLYVKLILPLAHLTTTWTVTPVVTSITGLSISCNTKSNPVVKLSSLAKPCKNQIQNYVCHLGCYNDANPWYCCTQHLTNLAIIVIVRIIVQQDYTCKRNQTCSFCGCQFLAISLSFNATQDFNRETII